jgi:16S rRNA (cytosine967-C5)-methyltransferase
MRVRGSDPLSRVLKASSSDQVPQKASLASAPDWLKDILSSSLGEDFRKVLADSLLPPRYLGGRANTLLTDREGLIKELKKAKVWVEGSELDPDGVKLLDGTSVDSLQAYREGRLEVQDLSSQLVCRLAVAGPAPSKVIDACAGNGGKTLALSALMGNKGALISMDNNERSLSRLRQRGRRAQVWNYQRVHVKGDEALEPYRNWADVVLVDAPCSGLGTLRRNPDIKLHLNRDQIIAFPALQLSLLKVYSRMVKAGGRLVYSTCTLNRAENEGVVNSFLSEAKGFELKDAQNLAPSLPKDLFRGPFFQPLPSEDRSGFFAAILLKV